MKLLRPILFVIVTLAAVAAAAIVINYRAIPSANTPQTHFDALIVLGNPANLDGTPGPEQRERTLEAVREYRAGVASHIIMTGGAAHNQYTEAHIMAALAATQGVPAAALLEEPQARNTIQNIFYSAEIMRQHGWHTAEIVSSPSHLPRSALIATAFDRAQPALAIDWRTHPSPWPPEYSLREKLARYSREASYCLRVRFFGFPRSRFLPAS